MSKCLKGINDQIGGCGCKPLPTTAVAGLWPSALHYIHIEQSRQGAVPDEQHTRAIIICQTIKFHNNKMDQLSKPK